jgi:ATP-binding cassette, subfamily C, bacterial CydCD
MKFIDPRLFRRSRSSRGLIIVAVLSAVLITLLTLLQANYLASLISRAFLDSDSAEELSLLVTWLIIVMSWRILLNYLSERTTSRISHKIRVELRSALFEKVLERGSELNLRFGPGRVALISTKAISNLEPYFTRFVPQIFIAAFVPIVVGVTITFLDLISGLIIIFTVPLIPIFGALIGKYTSEAMAKRWRTMGLLSGYLLDLLSGLTTLKLYGRERAQEKQIEEIGERYRKETMRVLRISFLTSLALELVATLSVALIAVTIGLRLVNGDFELWRGLMILILAPEVYWPIRNLSAQFHASADGIESAKDIFEILEFTPISEQASLPAPTRIKEISWDDLSIEYSDRSRFELPSGTVTAGTITVVTGPSGAGKSTLLNILLRLVSPISGLVRVDGVPLESYSRKSWLNQIAWVPQEPNFPSRTIRELFRLSSPNSSEPELKQVLQNVGLDGINLDSQMTLSIGQQRRIAIARALLRPTNVFIMDEPSASLDEATETKIIEILEQAAQKGKIVLTVSHRPNLISRANQIIDFTRILT